MTVTTASSSSVDFAPAVAAYIADPARVGYQLVTNYESKFWYPLVGKDAWLLFLLIRTHCYYGNCTCHLPIETMAACIRTAETRRITTGYTKRRNGKEYSYPGLISILLESGLLLKSERVDQRCFRFEVNLKPGPLTPAQVSQLPEALQRDHARFVQTVEEKLGREPDPSYTDHRRPVQTGHKELPQSGKFLNSDRNFPLEPGNFPTESGKFPKSDGKFPSKSGKFPPNKQHYDSHRSNDHEHSSNSEGLDKASSTVAALVGYGVQFRVATELCGRYSEGWIQEKIQLLQQKLNSAPGSIANPPGWLVAAIKQDYQEPSSHLSQKSVKGEQCNDELMAEIDRRMAEPLPPPSGIEAAEVSSKEPSEPQPPEEQEAQTLWQNLAKAQEVNSVPSFQQVIQDAHPLRVDENVLHIEIQNELSYDLLLKRPGLKEQLESILSSLAGRPMTIAGLGSR